MHDSALDTRDYKHALNNLLNQLKNQLEAQAHTLLAPDDAGQESLDDYLLELSTFYYKSFHERFFPQYEQIIKDDMLNLLHLSQDEAILKKNILASIKQYARIFNRVKHITVLLERKYQETQALLSTYYHGGEVRNVNLLYYLKEMAGNWSSFQTLIQNIQIMLKDDIFISALKQCPASAMAANLLGSWNPESSREVRDFNRLLAAWKLSTTLLVKLQDDPASAQEPSNRLVQEIKQADLNWDNRKVHPVIRTWYQQYIQQTFRLYLDCLNLNAEKRDSRRLSQTARQFGDWLGSLLIVMEQSMAYKSRGWEELAQQPGFLIGIEAEYLKEMDNYISRLLQSIDELIQSLSSSSRANFKNHSQRAVALLNISSEWMREQLENKSVPRPSVLNLALKQLKKQNDYLEIAIELLNDKEEHSANAYSQCKTIADTLDSYLELLAQIKDDLDRALSPRQINNTFQNIDVKIEHLTITAGARFPSQHNNLITEKLVETAVEDAPENQILYSEGDIFIFYLDDLIIYEIPKIIIAGKG